jgi:hypothetical protein
LAAPDHDPFRALARYGGGDSLTIWRWQGKASSIKALTMMERLMPSRRSRAAAARTHRLKPKIYFRKIQPKIVQLDIVLLF